MTRYLKTLGLALVAVLALSAVAASAASAGKLTLSGSGSPYPATLTGNQTEGKTNELVLEGGSRTTECSTVTYEGEYKESEVGEEMASATPSYSGCTSEILGNVTPTTVTTNGCEITLSISTVHSATKATGQAHVVCPGEEGIEIHVYPTHTAHTEDKPICTYTIPEQTASGTVEYNMSADHKKLSITADNIGLTGIARTSGTLTNCGKATQTGAITATAEIEAFDENSEQLLGTFS